MLANIRRQIRNGISTPAPTLPPPSLAENMIVSPPTTFHDPAMPAPFSMEELGFIWPNDRGFFSPSAIPLWLQEQVCLDIGLNSMTKIFVEPRRPWSSRQWLGWNLLADSWKEWLDWRFRAHARCLVNLDSH